MKSLLTVALAAVAALVLGVGAFQSTPSANADTTGLVLVGCELLAGGIDGDLTDATVAGDYALCTTALTPADLVLLDGAYGDDDGELEADDLADRDPLDANQIREGCTAAGPQCTLLAFVFVDDEKQVDLDLPAGLESVQSGTLDFVCDTEAEEADCSDVTPNDGDGAVVFHIFNDTADSGDEPTVRVLQEGVEQTADVTITGDAQEVNLVLVEDTVQVSGSSLGDVTTCQTTNDVTDADSITQANTTVLAATVLDLDDVAMARVTVALTTDDSDVARVATGSVANEITGDTGQTVDSGDTGIAQFAVVCGGRETGTTDVTAEIGAVTDRDTAELTVVGEPAEVVLAASPASIACDGTASSTVTATVTDSDGNNVADGVEVSFDVVALGTADPINVDTADGTASSTITPLSNASAGVTVLVTAGDVERSIRVDCSLPIPPQPTTPTGPVPTPTRTGIVGPDTGNGGYADQDAGFPMWTLIALAIGSVALVAGGVVTRKVTK